MRLKGINLSISHTSTLTVDRDGLYLHCHTHSQTWVDRNIENNMSGPVKYSFDTFLLLRQSDIFGPPSFNPHPTEVQISLLLDHQMVFFNTYALQSTLLLGN